MKPKISESISVYPGEFVPAESKAIKYEPAPGEFELKERPGLYEVHLSVPGMNRERFIVYGNNRHLLIKATPNREMHRNEKLNCNIPMPANADTELAIAEYKNSVLHVYIPKTKQRVKGVSTRIVVY